MPGDFFPELNPGDRLSAERVNDMSRAIEAQAHGFTLEELKTSSVTMQRKEQCLKIRLVRLTANLAGTPTATADGNIQVFDQTAQIWGDGDELIPVYNSGTTAYSSGDKVFVYFNRQADRWVPIAGAGGGGIQFFPAKITGFDGTSKYSWVEQNFTTGGTLTNKSSGRSGSPALNPAYEINGNYGVNVGNYVWMTMGFLNVGGTGQEYVFEGGYTFTFLTADPNTCVQKTISFVNGRLQAYV